MPFVPRLAVLVATLLPLAVATIPHVAAAAGPSFSIAPIRLELDATPGRPITDAIEVTNEAREAARIKVYTEDWRLERDGAVAFGRPGHGPRSASTWIRLNPAEFDLPPLASVDVRLTVNVPKGAPDGGYRAAIVVEQAPRPATGGRQVAIRARIASIIYVKVGKPVPDAALHGVAYRREPNGVRSLVLAVENRGQVHFRTSGRVVLKEPTTGRVLHRVAIPDVPVLPESARDVRADLPADVRPGTYASRTELDVGRDEIYVHEGPIRVE